MPPHAHAAPAYQVYGPDGTAQTSTHRRTGGSNGWGPYSTPLNQGQAFHDSESPTQLCHNLTLVLHTDPTFLARLIEELSNPSRDNLGRVVVQITATAQFLYNQYARSMLYTTTSIVDDVVFREHALHVSHKFRPMNFFKIGRVLSILIPDPAGETSARDLNSGDMVQGAFGSWVHQKVRKYIIVDLCKWHCRAIPITTYSQRGVSDDRVQKSDHGIVYTGNVAPEPMPNERACHDEEPMRRFPIRVDPDERGFYLEIMSRLDYSRDRPIEYNWKVAPFGFVNPSSMDHLCSQWRDVHDKKAQELPDIDSSQRPLNLADSQSIPPPNRNPHHSLRSDSRYQSPGGRQRSQSYTARPHESLPVLRSSDEQRYDPSRRGGSGFHPVPGSSRVQYNRSSNLDGPTSYGG